MRQFEIMNTFGEWLSEELNIRGMSQADLVRASGLSKQNISQLVNDTRSPGIESCKAISDALMLDTQYVLRKAKLLPPAREELSQEIQEIIQLAEHIPAHEQRYLLDLVRAYAQRWVRKE